MNEDEQELFAANGFCIRCFKHHGKIHHYMCPECLAELLDRLVARAREREERQAKMEGEKMS